MTAPDTQTTGLRAILDMSNWDTNSKRLVSSINSLNNQILGFARSSTQGMNQTSESINKMSSFAKRAEAVVYGILVADVFRGIARAARNMAEEALGAVSEFQVLKIQLDTLAARDYAREFGVPVSDALNEVGQQSQQLLNWIRQLAVTTPFSVQQVGSVFALARAYGFTSAQAQKLIVDVGDFTASMGLGDEVLRRIIYNMGQMVAQGKPTGRELRDLSNSFVPIGDLADRFAKKLGVTKAAVKDMWSTGEISAKEFIAEFERMVEEDVPGAMARMSRTLSAAANNIKDFFQSLVGYEVFGPVADELAGQVQDALEKALSPENYRRASAAGESLLFAYKQISDTFSNEVGPAISNFMSMLGSASPTTLTFAENILKAGAAIKLFGKGISSGLNFAVDTLNGLFGDFKTVLSNLSNNMYTWGQNIIVQFARGIVAGITFVVQALTAVARTITNLLRAHSPPALLPDLPNWGAAAMSSYMEGWASGDFSVFNDIQSMIEKSIMSLKISGKGGNEIDLITRVIGSSKDIAEAVNQFRLLGQVSSGTLDRIASSVGFADDAIRKFVTQALNTQKLQDLSDALSEIFNFKGVGQIYIFGQLVDSFDEIRDLAGRFGEELSGQVIQYTRDAQRLIDLNDLIASSQKEINDVTKKYDDILRDLNAQLQKVENQQEDLATVKKIDKALSSQILTADERKRLELEKERILLTRQIQSTEAAKDAEVSALQERLDALEEEKKALQDRADSEKEYLKTLTESRLKAAKAELQSIEGLLNAQIKLNELMSQSLSIKASVNGGGAGEFGEELVDEFLSGIQGALPEVEEGFQQALDELWATIQQQINEFLDPIRQEFDKLKQPFEDFKETWRELFDDPAIGKNLEAIGQGFQKAFKPFEDFWNADGKRIAETIGEMIGSIITNLTMSTPTTGKSVIQIIQESIEAIGNVLYTRREDIQNFFVGFKDLVDKVVIPKFKDILEFLGTEVLPGLVNFAIDAGPKILDLIGFIVSNADKIIAVLTAFKALELLSTLKFPAVLTLPLLIYFTLPSGETANTIQEAVKAEQERWGRVISGEEANGFQTTNFGETLKESVQDWTSETQTNIENWGVATGLSIGNWAMNTKREISEWIEENTSGILGWAVETKMGIQEWVSENTSGILSWAIDSKTNIQTWVEETKENIKGWATDTKEKIDSWVRDAGLKLSEFKTSAEETWNSIFGSEGFFARIFNVLFGGAETEGSLLNTFSSFGETIARAATGVFGTETGAEGSIAITIINFGKSIPAKMLKIGEDIVSGLIRGLGNKYQELVSKVQEVIAAIPEWVKGWFESHSESKVMRQIGSDLMLGLANGILESSLLPIRAMQAVARQISTPVSMSYPSLTGSGSTIINNDNRISVDMKPSYSTYQSPVGVYSDVMAALAAIAR